MSGVKEATYSSRGRRLFSKVAAPCHGGRGAAIVPRGGSVGSTSNRSGSTPQPSRADHVDDEYHPSEEEGEEDEHPGAEGSSSMARYKPLEKIKQRPVSDVEAYVEARRGDQDGTLCCQRATENLVAYTDAAKEIHDPDYNVMNSPLDATGVYKAGKGKKHSRFFMGAGYISTPTTLSKVRTTSTGSTDEVNSQRRLRSSTDMYSQLKARLQDEIEARQRLERMLQALLTRLDGTTPGAPPPTLSTPATVGSMADPVASGADVEDGTHVSCPNQDHVDEFIADRPPPEVPTEP